jgi:hypothetical protein
MLERLIASLRSQIVTSRLHGASPDRYCDELERFDVALIHALYE